ncbi:dTDP-4-dehydrorhamnose 3,5-epimerase [Aureimonas glaciei]|nr:dTDP-4-dehydrorhamnose 3,5-epimerase [Aureimonas glaciei]
MIDIRPLAISDVLEVRMPKFGDERGYFSETYNRQRFVEAGIADDWCQDNHSLSVPMHTLRGLHFQVPPFAQAKLVRVIRGRALDVAVDLREGSASFGQYVTLELSPDRFNQIYIPVGFAHGFLTLEPNTEVLYKVSSPYSKDHDRSLRWDDPDIGIDWALNGATPILSDKDRDAPGLAGARFSSLTGLDKEKDA